MGNEVSDSNRVRSAARPAPIRLRGECRTLDGFLYGSSQPLMLLTIEVKTDAAGDLDALDRAIRALADNFPFEPAGGGGEGLASRAAELTRAVQAHFGHPLYPFRRIDLACETAELASYRLMLPYHDRQVAPQVAGWAVTTLNALLGAPHDGAIVQALAKELSTFGAALRLRAPGDVNTTYFVRAGWQLGIPVRRLVGNIYRFGNGSRARLLDSSFTDRTPIIAAKIALDKPAAAHVLRSAGLPVPDHVVVATPDAASSAAERMGFPLVVKPTGEDGGRGVSAGLRDREAFAAAVTEAFKFSKQILVERHVAGDDFRLTVLDGKVIKIMQRVAASVTGDGGSTIAELVAVAQANPRLQRVLRERGKMPIELDDEALGLLREHGLDPSSVLASGQRAVLRRKNNVSTGGDQVGIAVDSAHPDNLALAVRAAELLYLDFAGVDLLISDIRASWQGSGAAICEVNSRPQVGIRTSPEIYAEILPMLLEGAGRIPLHLVVSKEGESLPRGALDELAQELSCNAVASEDGAWIDGEKIVAGPLGAFANFENLLAHSGARAAVGVMTIADIARTGLPCHRFDSIIDRAGDGFHRIKDALAPHADRLVTSAPGPG